MSRDDSTPGARKKAETKNTAPPKVEWREVIDELGILKEVKEAIERDDLAYFGLTQSERERRLRKSRRI